MKNRLSLFPPNSVISDCGHLVIGGCDAETLAEEFGTPLYVFDEATLRTQCAEFVTEFGSRYPEVRVLYAAKAFLSGALLALLQEEGLGLDVVSPGELGLARRAGFPLERVYCHGNNKSAAELRQALEWGVGRIVVDNFYELELLNQIAGGMRLRPEILLRLSPGVDPHTHRYIATGVIDSKFGFPMVDSAEAVCRALAAPNLCLVGLHCHIGSLITEVAPYEAAVDRMLGFAAETREKYGFELKELDIGGGFAIPYTCDAVVPPVAVYADVIAAWISDRCRELGMTLPRLVIEPGRAIVGQAGVAIYRVGAIKEIAGVRCYASVDGGMGDNIRPALYGAQYEAVGANKMNEADSTLVTLAGRFCESGDILIKDIYLPPLTPGDLVTLPCCGAYCIPMASNYNAFMRPAVVMVKGGKARLIRRRETLDDLTRSDVFLGGG